MINTKDIADEIVSGLQFELKKHSLPSFKSIYILGSYCRGDWLNCSSDLDIHTIYNDESMATKNKDFALLKHIVDDILNNREFPSHCPGGIEYGFNRFQDVPKTYESACIPSPYAPFSICMFDLKENHITVYGSDLNNILPPHPDPKSHAKQWLSYLVKRISEIDEDNFRIPFITYKAITAAQMHFGKPSINKYRILELYQKHIPHFPMKHYGEIVIRNYLGSIYPNRLPVHMEKADCMEFLDELLAITKKHQAVNF